MKKILIPLIILILTGQGCLGLGGQEQAVSTGGIFKSLNSGEVWDHKTAVPSSKGVGSIATVNILSMEMDPQDHDTLYIGTRQNGLLYSLNGAASWQQAREPGLKTGAITAIDVNPKDVCTLYVAKGPRLYKTDNCLRTFDDEAYLDSRGVSISEIKVDWFNSEVVWLALSNGDAVKSTDGGKTWRTVLTAKSGITGLLISNADSRNILVGTVSDGFYRSSDSGASWEQIEKEMKKEFKSSDRVYHIVQSADASAVLSSSQFGILKSNDFGLTWEKIGLLTTPGQATILALEIDPSDSNRIAYATTGTFYLSSDGGQTWETKQIPSTRIPQDIIIDPENGSVLYIGVAEPVKK